MLARIRKSMEENQEGFTLIELLVVIIIIGILAAIAIPVFLNQRKKGYEASMKSDLRTVANEMETWYTDNQAYTGATGFASTGAAITSNGTVGTDSVTLSKGNTVTLTKAGNSGFCLTATSTQTSKTFIYDSLAGGLNGAASCSASGY